MAAPAGIYITELDGAGAEPDGAGERTSADAAAGATLAVKDLFDTAGVRTTYGSAVFAAHVPDRTAAAVERLVGSSYRMVGKANLHEFAWGITSENPHYGTVPNPIAPGRVAGGSSGGSGAALAAGIAEAALGSDSAGSIRIPAACCGVTGHKPTHGLVPIDGCWPLAPSFDVAGPMARDVAGCSRMMQALVPGFAVADLASLDDVRVAVAWIDRADPLVRERVEAAAALFGDRRPLDLPLPDGVYPAFAREAATVHAKLFREHRDEYGENVATKVARALEITDGEAATARAALEAYRARIAELTAGVDLVVTPTVPMVAPPTGIGDLVLRERMIELTFPWSAAGAPALALPCGPAEDGLPASVQIAGRPGDDALVLAAGALLEAALADGAPR